MSSAMRGLSQSMRTKLAKAREAELAGQFVAMCRRFGIPRPELEYQFAAPERRWRIDFAWPDQRIALESEGGLWTGGRHTRGAGFMADIEKYNHLAMQGYRLFRVVPAQLTEYPTLQMIARALGKPIAPMGRL